MDRVQSCNICGLAFSKMLDMNNHMIAKHRHLVDSAPEENENGKNNTESSICGIVIKEENVHNSVKSEDDGSPYIDSGIEIGEHQLIEPDVIIRNSTSCTVCEKVLSSKDALKTHIRSHEGEKPFKCDLCPKSFSLARILKHHKTCHEKGGLKVDCDICGKKFAHTHGLKLHMYLHTGDAPYKCSICQRSFTTKSWLKYHTASKHTNERNYTCMQCKKTFIKKSQLKQHILSHYKVNGTICEICGNLFLDEFNVKQHKIAVHKLNSKDCDVNLKRISTCGICGKTMKSILRIRKHILLEHMEHVKCKCGAHFASIDILMEHQKTACLHGEEVKIEEGEIKSEPVITPHGVEVKTEKDQLDQQDLPPNKEKKNICKKEKTFKCDMCPKSFYLAGGLNRHKAFHGEGRAKFGCDICGKKFSQNSTLRLHKRLHTGNTPYKCSICQKFFYNSGLLKYHIASKHTNDRKYNCMQCGKSFLTKSHLKLHNLYHNKVKGIICEICGKLFLNRKNVIQHKKDVHNVISKVCYISTCGICGKTMKRDFIRSHILLQHKKHVKCECNKCGASFGSIDVLIEHQKTLCLQDVEVTIEEEGISPEPIICPKVVEVKIEKEEGEKGHSQQHNLLPNKVNGNISKKENSFKCDMCPKSFTVAGSLKRHKISHNEGGFKIDCDICGKTFSQTSGLKQHMYLHTGDAPFKCSICQKSFTTSSWLKYHIASKHTNKRNYSCTQCGKSFIIKSHLHIHNLSHNKVKGVICNICGKLFRYRNLAMQHKICVHNLNSKDSDRSTNTCGICGKTMKDIKRHILITHREHVKCECNKCGASFGSIDILIEHQKTNCPYGVEVTGENEEISPKLITDPNDAEVTIEEEGISPQSIINPKVIEVKIGKKEGKRDRLEDHHLPPNKVKENICKKENAFKCDMCPKSFSLSGSLKRHKTCHKKGGLKVDCHICGKKFAHPHGLKLHMYLHTGDAPFKCSKCQRSFTTKSWLKYHTASEHTKERNYSCMHCKKTFIKKSHLKHHILSHYKVNGTICEICGKLFLYRNNVIQHQIEVHNINSKDCNAKNPTSTCGICGKTLKTVRIRNHILLEHKEHVKCECNKCGAHFDSIDVLTEHTCPHGEEVKSEEEEISSEPVLSPKVDEVKIEEEKINPELITCPNGAEVTIEEDEITPESIVCPKVIEVKIEEEEISSELITCPKDFELTIEEEEINPIISPKVVEIKTEEEEINPELITCLEGAEVTIEEKEISAELITWPDGAEVKIEKEEISHDPMICPKVVEVEINPELITCPKGVEVTIEEEKISPQIITRPKGVEITIEEEKINPIVGPKVVEIKIEEEEIIPERIICPKVVEIKIGKEKRKRDHPEQHSKKAKENISKKGKTFKCDMCPKSFCLSGSLKRHKTCHKKGGLKVDCDICGKKFSNIYALKQHMYLHTGDAPYKCSMCQRSFPSKDWLKYHTASEHTKERNYSCMHCNKAFIKKSHLKHHILSHYKVNGTICEICGKLFLNQDNVIQHQIEVHNINSKDRNAENPTSTCGICGKTMKSARIRNHILLKHKEHVKCECNKCGAHFDSIDILTEHTCSHGVEIKLENSEPIISPKSIEIAIEKEEISAVPIISPKVVEEEEIMPELIACPKGVDGKIEEQEISPQPIIRPKVVEVKIEEEEIGPELINRPKSVEITIEEEQISPEPIISPKVVETKIEEEEIKPELITCSKHAEVTIEEEEISSEAIICPKVVEVKIEKEEGKKDHLEQHTNKVKENICKKEKTFKCDMCPKSFCLSGSLKRHKTCHKKGGLKVDCDICGKKISNIYALKQHMYLHTGDAPYKCSVCQRSFTTKDWLKYHTAAEHTKERNYSCMHCKKTFIKKSHLKQHILSHYKVNGSICEICGKLFLNRKNVVQHQIEMHNINSKDCKEKNLTRTCGICGKTMRTVRIRNHILLEHKEHVKCECNKCGAHFDSIDILSEHLKTTCPHGEEIKIEEEEIMTESFISLQSPDVKIEKEEEKGDYLQQHHLPPNKVDGNIYKKQKTFKCDMCSKTFLLDRGLKRHKAFHESGWIKLDCDICGKKFTLSSSLKLHKRLHTGETPYKCSLCQNSFTTSSSLKKHIASKHTNERNYTCMQCGKSFITNTHLRLHSLSHNKVEGIICEICGKLFLDQNCMVQHKIDVHNLSSKDCDRRANTCGICGKTMKSTFVRKHILLQHKKHVKCECNKCGARFGSTDILIEHQKTPCPQVVDVGNEEEEISLEPFTNPKVVEKKIGKEGGKKNHLQQHNLPSNKMKGNICEIAKTFKCDLCPKSFYLDIMLKRHKIFHERGILKLDCDICGRKFSKSNALKDHMYLHTGETPFKCSICPKSFNTKSWLKYHIASQHTNERNYKCTQCGKSFLSKSHLQLHNLCHNKVEGVMCDFCGKLFLNRDLVVQHKIDVHNLNSNDCDKNTSICGICGKTIKHVRRHILMKHREHVKCECNKCGTCFGGTDMLIEHQKTCQQSNNLKIGENEINSELIISKSEVI